MIYDFDYENEQRFVSYYHQIKNIIECNPKTVLEIGRGSGIVSEYLKRAKIKVMTMDINASTKPDFIDDITTTKIKDNSFDCVSCCEVLEHIPFESFDKSLIQISRISRKNAIISLPYPSLHFGFVIQNLIYSINISELIKHPPRGHYFEIGTRRYSISKIRYFINRHFVITKEYRSKHNPYHYFFILEKRNKGVE